MCPLLKKCLFSLLLLCGALSAAPKAIIFDFGGVMTTEPNRELVVNFLSTSFDLSREEFKQANEEKKEAVKAGKNDVNFWQDYAREIQVALPDDWVQSFNDVMKKAIGAVPEMYDLAYQLRDLGYTVGMLSNIDARLANLINLFGLYDPFDPCLLSYELGVEKPDAKIYEILIHRLDLPAEEIVFIDDKIENVEAAKALGIDAILFVSHQDLIKEFSERELL